MLPALLLSLLLALPPAPRVELGASVARVEVADSFPEWVQGLMDRTELDEDAGMLFVFPEDVTYSFWMHDTPLPLSIAFIDADGRILDTQDMAPNSDDLHSSPAPYRYALEVNQGYFARHAVVPGDVARIWIRRVSLPLVPL